MAAQAYLPACRPTVVDVDLEKYFERVNHDILIDQLRRRIDNAGVIRRLRVYLSGGIMAGGLVQERCQGTQQGGQLSPLLVNVVLDEVGRESERRGHCLARYADDCIRLRSQLAGRRTVMALLRSRYGRLRLTVKEAKSAGPL